jgi:CHAT domain-containing protein
MYPYSTLLISAEATRKRALQAMQSADVVHIAAHAMIDNHDAGRSVLLLSSSGEQRGDVQLQEIAALDLDGVDLVVLAGCRTATMGGGHGNIRSLASAFLAAGSQSVVGTLWDVDDRAAREVSTRLHARMRSGSTVADALREVQAELRRSQDPLLRNPSTWSAYQVYGSGASVR